MEGSFSKLSEIDDYHSITYAAYITHKNRFYVFDSGKEIGQFGTQWPHVSGRA